MTLVTGESPANFYNTGKDHVKYSECILETKCFFQIRVKISTTGLTVQDFMQQAH